MATLAEIGGTVKFEETSKGKGKKVLMGMIPRSSDELILCVDADFDFLFADRTEQSREVNNARYMFHTYGGDSWQSSG